MTLTPGQWARVQDAFAALLELAPAERAAALAGPLDADAAVEAEVRRLVAAHGTTGLLDHMADRLREAGSDGASVDAAADAAADPVRIGVWQVEELIGRGGMGSVYRAHRADGQFAQRAAIKLLRRDALDPDLRRRFLAERRILGRIEHPGIARILDGGITPEGRPWFALEYVEGSPIDAWCTERALDVRTRLALFREVCAAVQHAHAQLVVHRDIKPANVMVTHEGRVRLLDFGIARLLDPDAFPDDGGTTATGAFLLTPGYASPEQLRGEPVGVASDVFQLGVLLFVLLAGRLPRRAEVAGYGAHAVGERPSDAGVVGARRRIDRDLDTIVATATNTEPGRRYVSVDRLSDDVQRWLDGLPIRARPDTFGYRTRRFVQRNRVGVGLAAALTASVMAFALVSARQARRVERERDRAREVITFVTELFSAPDPRVAGGSPVTAREILDRGTDRVEAGLGDPLLRAELLGVLGSTYFGIGAYDEAVARLREALVQLAASRGDPRTIAEVHGNLALAHARTSRPDSALVHAGEAVRLLRRHAPGSAELAGAIADVAYVHMVRGDHDAAQPFFDEAIALFDALPDSPPRRLAPILTNLAWSAQSRGDLAQAEAMMRRSLALRRATVGVRDAALLAPLGGLATILTQRGALEAADSFSAEGLAVAVAAYPAPHPEIALALGGRAAVLGLRGDAGADTLFTMALSQTHALFGPASLPAANLANEIGAHHFRRGDLERAQQAFAEATAAYAAVRGAHHSSAVITARNRVQALQRLGRLAEGEAVLRDVVAAMAAAEPDSVLLATTVAHRGFLLAEMGRHAEAEPVLRSGYELAVRRSPPGAPAVISIAIDLGGCLAAQRRFDEAEPLYLAAYEALVQGGADRPVTRRHAGRLAAFYEAWDRPEEAARYRAEAAEPPAR